MARDLFQILTDAVETARQRRATYKAARREDGKGHWKHGHVMKALFPNGIPLNTPDDFTRLTTFNMMVAKLVRYADNWEEGGHQDSVHDLGVYSFLLEEIDEEIFDHRG